MADAKPVFTSVAETKAQIEKYFYRVEVIERNLAFQGEILIIQLFKCEARLDILSCYLFSRNVLPREKDLGR